MPPEGAPQPPAPTNLDPSAGALWGAPQIHPDYNPYSVTDPAGVGWSQNATWRSPNVLAEGDQEPTGPVGVNPNLARNHLSPLESSDLPSRGLVVSAAAVTLHGIGVWTGRRGRERFASHTAFRRDPNRTPFSVDAVMYGKQAIGEVRRNNPGLRGELGALAIGAGMVALSPGVAVWMAKNHNRNWRNGTPWRSLVGKSDNPNETHRFILYPRPEYGRQGTAERRESNMIISAGQAATGIALRAESAHQQRRERARRTDILTRAARGRVLDTVVPGRRLGVLARRLRTGRQENRMLEAASWGLGGDVGWDDQTVTPETLPRRAADVIPGVRAFRISRESRRRTRQERRQSEALFGPAGEVTREPDDLPAPQILSLEEERLGDNLNLPTHFRDRRIAAVRRQRTGQARRERFRLERRRR